MHKVLPSICQQYLKVSSAEKYHEMLEKREMKATYKLIRQLLSKDCFLSYNYPGGFLQVVLNGLEQQSLPPFPESVSMTYILCWIFSLEILH